MNMFLVKIIPYSRLKRQKNTPYFRLKQLENHTLKCGIYPYSLYIGIPPTPIPRESDKHNLVTFISLSLTFTFKITYTNHYWIMVELTLSLSNLSMWLSDFSSFLSPESPRSPYRLINTFELVPALDTSPVMT